MGPITGNLFKNPNTTGKKSLYHHRVEFSYLAIISLLPSPANSTYPNRFKNPKISTIKPKNGYLLSTRRIPPKKQIVPLSFSFLEKKTNVLLGPIIAVIPHKNNTFYTCIY